jgi:hypothetical protein
MPPKPRKPAKPPAKQNLLNPNEKLVSKTQSSMDDLLELQKQFLAESDAVLFYDVRLETRTGNVATIRGTATLSGIMSKQRMSQSSREIQDHIESLILVPMAEVLQVRASDAALEETAEEDHMFPPLPSGVAPRLEPPVESTDEPTRTAQDARAEPA